MFVKCIILTMSFLCFCLSASAQELAQPLVNGHAHNDYEKARPGLTAALENGFVSVEIDVFVYKNTLRVAHVPLLLGCKQELEPMYFESLEAWIKRHEQVFSNPKQELIFMIDIKNNPTEAYGLLKGICKKYEHLLTYYDRQENQLYNKQLKILLSGKKPYVQVLKEEQVYLFLDGNWTDLKKADGVATIIPRISMRYGSIFKWRGRGEMPQHEQEKLQSIVAKAHAKGHKIRFWAMPNNSRVWQVMLDAGVDWMNVDHLEKFRAFYEQYSTKNKPEEKGK